MMMNGSRNEDEYRRHDAKRHELSVLVVGLLTFKSKNLNMPSLFYNNSFFIYNIYSV